MPNWAGDVYGFYLADEMRLTWINLFHRGRPAPLKTGTPQAAKDRWDYDFDVAPATGLSLSGAVVACCQPTILQSAQPPMRTVSASLPTNLFRTAAMRRCSLCRPLGACWRSGRNRSLTLTRRSKRSWTDITLSPVWRLTPYVSRGNSEIVGESSNYDGAGCGRRADAGPADRAGTQLSGAERRICLPV